MKTIRLFIYAFMALLAGTLVSCVEENLYEAGTPDLENCYGVYFPSQENLKSHEFEPVEEGSEDTYTKTFIVKRLKGEGAIKVPYTISDAKMFTGSEISFEDGQTSTTFDLTLSNDAEVGITYDCNISITDPGYALSYSEYKTGMDFSMIVVKWNRLKGPEGEEYGRWRDDFISAIFNGPCMENENVIIEERDDKPGYFRIKDAYSPAFWGPAFGETEEAFAPYFFNSELIVDASNPEKVFIPYQRLFDAGFANGGTIGIVQFTDKNLDIEPSESLYGTYDIEKGIIEYPKDAFYITEDGVPYWYGNANEMFRIVLPGFNPVDYSLTLEPGLAYGGELEVAYTFGADVSKIRYAIYPGKLSDAAIKDKADEIGNDKEPNAVEIREPAEGTFTVSGLEDTGVYTIVTVNYTTDPDDATEPDIIAGYSSENFNYIKAGEDVPVVMTVELNTTDKFASAGLTSENSLEMYVAGTDIQKAYMLIDKESAFAGLPDAIMPDLFEMLIENRAIEPLDDETLEEINGTGLLDVADGLVPGELQTYGLCFQRLQMECNQDKRGYSRRVEHHQ